MQVLRVNRKSDNFYEYLGPVFGSRVVEQDTRDRFYDDPKKEWFLIPGQGAASVLGQTIKNFWAASPEAAERLLEEIMISYGKLSGIVPCAHEKAFKKLGFHSRAFRKNFIEVHYEKD